MHHVKRSSKAKDSYIEYNLIIEDFRNAIGKLFGRMVVYAYIGGTFNYGGAVKRKSDIDVTIVFKDNVKKRYCQGKILRFIKIYNKIHKKYNYASDGVFPGEYVRESQIREAIKGRGFSIKSGNIYLPSASNKYYLEDVSNWYRAWLSSSAFSSYIYGDKTIHEKYKIMAWKEVILYYIYSKKIRRLSCKSLFKTLLKSTDKWADFGVTSRYVNFVDLEEKYVSRALSSLVKNKYFFKDKEDYKINSIKLEEWNTCIVKRNLKNKWNCENYLFE